MRRGIQRIRRVLAVPSLLLLTWAPLKAQKDPGPRGGDPGAGQPFSTLTLGEKDFFTNHGIPQFTQVEAVSDGLGPRFNLNSCGGCHAQPAVGGSSPAVNPQFALASTMAPGSTVPSFITASGPVREARFIKNSNGSPDGGVHDVFTITGRSDAPGCSLQQPEFAAQLNAHNVIFRIPTPLFGSGLIEAITDTTLKQNLASDPGFLKARLGIKGHFNTSGNDGTITRFGWKAQNKSLLIFAGEAYNVEMGITNENFPTEREENTNCNSVPTPNNFSGFNVGETDPADILSFMGFMKFLDQPQAVTSYGKVSAASIQNGSALFVSVGCALCHTASLTTGSNSSASLNNVKARLFSDLAVHQMGSALADGVTQGTAGPEEFRTAPLWGVGQRLFFLHDGRTSDLLEAIEAHSSGHGCEGETRWGGFSRGSVSSCESEADKVIEQFNALSSSQKQDLLNFLRSL